MKAIIREFVEGDSSRKLAIIADIATILGVSVATVVAGPFLSKFSGVDFILSDFIVAILFYFLCLWFALLALYEFVLRLIESYSTKEYGWIAGKISFGLLALWLCIISFPITKSIVGNAFDSSYLLAPTGHDAISNDQTQNVLVKIEGGYVTSKGKIVFNKNMDANNYVAAIYLPEQDGQYNMIGKASEFNASGEFFIPSTSIYEFVRRDDAYLVIYRKTDWRLTDFVNSSNNGYPSVLNVIPNFDLDQMHAWFKKVDVVNSKQLMGSASQ